MERRELERRFMVDNLVVGENDDRRATEEEVGEAMKEIFGEIGFHLTRPLVSIISYGYMPDEQSVTEHRYWATFQTDATSALEIWEQQRGIAARIEAWNQKTCGGEAHQKARWLVLKKHQGTPYEATMRTLQAVVGILANTVYSEVDGFRLDVHQNELRLFFEKQIKHKLTVKQVYEEHRDAFDEAIQTLPEEQRRSMLELVGRIHRTPFGSRKRHHITLDDTVSSAIINHSNDSEATPPPQKAVHLATPIPKRMRRMDEREVSPCMPKDFEL